MPPTAAPLGPDAASDVRPVRATVVSTRATAAASRDTVRSLLRHLPGAEVHVGDLDGTYAAVGDEVVRSPRDLGLDAAHVHRAALVHGPAAARLAAAALVAQAPAHTTVLVVAAGVVLLAPPDELLTAAATTGVAVVARAGRPLPRDGRWPAEHDVAAAGVHTDALLAVLGAPPALLDAWRDLDGLPDGRWLDVALGRVTHHVLRAPEVLVSAWTLAPADHLAAPDPGADALTLDGAPVVALDLTALDPAHPWLLTRPAPGDPRARLSDHPALAALVRRAAGRRAADTAAGSGPDLTSVGAPPDDVLRGLVRDAEAEHRRSGAALPPDPFDPASASTFADWLAAPGPDGVLGRYLTAVRRARPDLQDAFPGVPGEHTAGYLGWAREHGLHEAQYSHGLLRLALDRAGTPPEPPGRAPRPHGVNVVGYLRGELGIGESARLMLAALDAAHVPHRAVSAERHLASRQTAAAVGGAETRYFDTSLVCVNADMTAAITATAPRMLHGTHRIGMWYWEVETFPAEQHAGFAHVDEVWVATEFVRAAVAPHSPVPVHLLTPPLPQPRTLPPASRAAFGLPDGPVLLFSFDYLSTVERKNPRGLLEAFTRAFPEGSGPVLVLKSINADQRPDAAEELRLHAAERSDVVLLEDYLDAHDRDALLATCDVYVSLHRSEGLGLTMAEAMAQGKPVIATGYSGNTEFMTEENSFLVPWTPTPVPEGAAPYPAGATWAAPDLDAAAALMRLVVEDPALAAERGRRAALDVTAYSPAAVGRRVAERLDEIHRGAARRSVVSRARGVVGRVRRG